MKTRPTHESEFLGRVSGKDRLFVRSRPLTRGEQNPALKIFGTQDSVYQAFCCVGSRAGNNEGTGLASDCRFDRRPVLVTGREKQSQNDKGHQMKGT
jgi:hypothetical protein